MLSGLFSTDMNHTLHDAIFSVELGHAVGDEWNANACSITWELPL